MASLDSFLDVRLEVPALPWQGPVPAADIDSRAFWEGLQQHRLLIARCDECGFFVHPPLAGCPRCLSSALSSHEVSGRGVVYSFTVVNREFAPGVKPPYVAAYVDLDEQEALRMLTNIVNVRIGDIQIGMPVQVRFCDIGDATLAMFEPVEEASP
ncbi:MAG: Zn-ribbon domain-containing OB-fold protein [Acidimicrobiales bacterium]